MSGSHLRPGSRRPRIIRTEVDIQALVDRSLLATRTRCVQSPGGTCSSAAAPVLGRASESPRAARGHSSTTVPTRSARGGTFVLGNSFSSWWIRPRAPKVARRRAPRHTYCGHPGLQLPRFLFDHAKRVCGYRMNLVRLARLLIISAIVSRDHTSALAEAFFCFRKRAVGQENVAFI